MVIANTALFNVLKPSETLNDKFRSFRKFFCVSLCLTAKLIFLLIILGIFKYRASLDFIELLTYFCVFLVFLVGISWRIFNRFF
jgi:hypothetical protein